MTAEPDWIGLQERVEALEHQMRNILPNKIDAVSFGLGVLHEDVRAFHQEMAAFRDETQTTLAQHGDRLGELATTLARQGGTLTQHGALLQEILRRLPPARDN
jgi:hypothetical protein